MQLKEKLVRLDETSDVIKDGDSIGIGGASLVYKPMAVVREIIRHGIKNLKVYTLMGDVDVDMLIGAGCTKRVYVGYVGFPMIGMAPNFRRAAENGQIEVKEYSELTFCLGLRAAYMGVPFFPTHSLLGSDLLKIREDFKVFDCPVTNQKLVAIPAIKPDVALIHGYQADPYGNVLAIERQIMIDFITSVAKSANKTIVTVEKIINHEEVLQHPEKVILPHYEVDFLVEVPYGAHPSGFLPLYPPDITHLAEYRMAAANPESFKDYLKKYVHKVKTHEEYLEIAKNI